MMAEYELFVDTEFAESRGMRGPMASGKVEVPSMKLNELEAKAATKDEVLVELRDPATLETFKARVVIGMKSEDLPGADTLWLIRTSGRFSSPWAVKIVERVEDDDQEVRALPRRRLSLAERKGRILSDLLKEREEKMRGGKKDGSER